MATNDQTHPFAVSDGEGVRMEGLVPLLITMFLLGVGVGANLAAIGIPI